MTPRDFLVLLVLCMVFGVVLFYLLGSFIAAAWNPMVWPSEGRALLCFLSVVWTVISALILHDKVRV